MSVLDDNVPAAPLEGLDMLGSLNLGQVEEDPNFTSDGKHRAHLFSAKISKFDKGKYAGIPQLVLTFKVSPGEQFAGAERQEYLAIIPSDQTKMAWLKRRLKSLGLEENAMDSPNLGTMLANCVGEEYIIDVKKNGQYINIRGVEQVGASSPSVTHSFSNAAAGATRVNLADEM